MKAFLNKYVIGAVVFLASIVALWFSGRRSGLKDAEVVAAKAETERVKDEASADKKVTEYRVETMRKANDVKADIISSGGSSVDRLRRSRWNTDRKDN